MDHVWPSVLIVPQTHPALIAYLFPRFAFLLDSTNDDEPSGSQARSS